VVREVMNIRQRSGYQRSVKEGCGSGRGCEGLGQAIAREFGPSGIHAAVVTIDGAMSIPAPDLVASLPPDGMLGTEVNDQRKSRRQSSPCP
jgi:hypothetical protein